jgi:hypothetical protein
MLLLIKEASKLVELIRFLQKFIKGDILKFLRAVKFAKYEKPLLQALSKISGKLVDLVKSLRGHLESLSYFDRVKATIAKLAAWEKKFYAVQQDAIRQVPKALAELDARLTKLLSETAPKEAHTVPAGVQADKAAAAAPAKQRVKDTPGKVMPKVEDKPATPKPKPATTSAAKSKPKPKAAPKPPAAPPPPLKDAPEPVKPPDEGANTKKQAVADVAVAADRERITQLSNEAREAQKKGDTVLAQAKIEEARDILRPYLPKKSGDSWDEIVKRLDVSSPRDGAVFWSGDPKTAQKFAEGIHGVTLETTAGGRIIDEWPDLKSYNWVKDNGPPPHARDLWKAASEKYAEGASGIVNTVQTADKLDASYTLWHNVEKRVIADRLDTGDVTALNMYVIQGNDFVPLEKNVVKSLMAIVGTAP